MKTALTLLLVVTLVAVLAVVITTHERVAELQQSTITDSFVETLDLLGLLPELRLSSSESESKSRALGDVNGQLLAPLVPLREAVSAYVDSLRSVLSSANSGTPVLIGTLDALQASALDVQLVVSNIGSSGLDGVVGLQEPPGTSSFIVDSFFDVEVSTSRTSEIVERTGVLVSSFTSRGTVPITPSVQANARELVLVVQRMLKHIEGPRCPLRMVSTDLQSVVVLCALAVNTTAADMRAVVDSFFDVFVELMGPLRIQGPSVVCIDNFGMFIKDPSSNILFLDDRVRRADVGHIETEILSMSLRSIDPTPDVPHKPNFAHNPTTLSAVMQSEEQVAALDRLSSAIVQLNAAETGDLDDLFPPGNEGSTVGYPELVDRVTAAAAGRGYVGHVTVLKAMDSFFDITYRRSTDGERSIVDMEEFGSFAGITRGAFTVVVNDPSNVDVDILVTGKRVVRFKAGSALSNAVN